MKNKWKKIISGAIILAMVASVIPMNQMDTQAATKDAFGMELDTSIKDKDAEKANNPYGTTGWTTLVSGDELFMAKGFENTRKFETFNYNEDGQEGNIGNAVDGSKCIASKEEGNSDGFKMMDTVGIDPNGEGQKRYIATMGYWRWKNRRIFQLFLTDKAGNRISNEVQISDKDNLDYLNGLDAHHVNGYVSIAAGDFDGDGKDSLIVYVPEGKTGHPHIQEYNVTSNGSSFTITDSKKQVIENVYGTIGCRTLKDPHGGRDVPVVQMTVADTDRDSIDELIITAGIPDTKAGDIPERDSKMMIFDKVGTKNSEGNVSFAWNKTYTCTTNNYNSGTSGDKRLRFASSSVGNVIVANSGVDYPEIVTCGWIDKHDGNGTKLTDRIGSYITTCTGVDAETLCGKYTSSPVSGIGTTEFTEKGHFEGDHTQALVPISVFNADGKTGGAASVFIADSVYSYSNGQWTHLYHNGDFNDDDDGLGGYVLSNNLIQDVASGNFTCSPDGREEVVFSKMQKQVGKNKYWYTIYTYKKDGDNWTSNKSSYVVEHKSTPYLSLCSFDCDADSIIARVKDVQKVYTEPEVITILESTPYFSEVNEGDVGNSQTVYGVMKGQGSSKSSSHGLTTEIIGGFEWNVDDICAGFACGAGFEASIENNFTWSTEESKSTSFELSYANDSGENMVVVGRRPVWAYEYEMKNSDNTMILSRQGELITSMITVDDYNEIASSFNMDPISEGMLCSPGNPLSYRSDTSGLKDPWVSKKWTQYHGNGTLEQTLSEETESVSSFETEHTFSFSVYGILFGVKGGAGAGYAYTQSSSTISTSGISKGCAVTCIDEEGYDFDWQFANWKIKLNNEDIPVIGYILKDVDCPPSPPENLSSKDVTTNMATLTWEAGERPAQGYYIYQVYQNDEKVRVAEVDGTENEFRLSNLLPDTSYTYSITGYTKDGSKIKESVQSEEHTLTTLPEGLGSVDMVSPKDSSIKVGQNTEFAAGITVNSQYYNATNYQWQKRNKGGAWENIPTAKSSKLSLSNVTMDDNNTEYRCIFKVSYSNASALINYYSEAASLGVSEVEVKASLTISGHDNTGAGSNQNPYKGLADSERQTGTQKTKVETTKNVEIPANGGIPKLTVYEDANHRYYGIGSNNNETVYYYVTKSGQTYTAGKQIVERYVQNYYVFDKTQSDESKWVKYEEWGDKYEPFSNENGYALVCKVTGEYQEANSTLLTNNITGSTYYWRKDGKYYYDNNGNVGEEVNKETVGNPYDVYKDVHMLESSLFLGRTESWPSSEEEGATESEYLYLKIGSAANPQTQSITYSCTYLRGRNETYKYYDESDLNYEYPLTFDPSELSRLTITKEEEVELPVYQTQAGSKLTLSTTVTEEGNKALANMALDFKVTNTQTGAVETLAGVTDQEGKASTEWVASTSGLYKVEVITRKQSGYLSANSGAQYYEASKAYDKTTVEYRLNLFDESGKQLSGSITYGSSVKLQLQSRTVTVGQDGKNTYGAWQNKDDNIRYCVKDSNAAIDNKTYTPDTAGKLVFEAYKSGSSTPLAEANLQVTRKNITVKPEFEGSPASAADVTITSNDSDLNSLNENDPFYLKNIFDVKCDYFSEEKQSGIFDVTLEYKTPSNQNAVTRFKTNYNVTFESDQFRVLKDSINIEYEAGENGSLNGKYSDQRFPFVSGTTRFVGTFLEFDAVPSSGYAVGSWTINGKSYPVASGLTDKQKTELQAKGITFSNSNKKLTIDTLSTSNTENGLLTVRVDFVSITKTVTYSVGGEGAQGGSIQAKEGSGYSIKSGAKVEKGSNITFTASPEEGYIVDYWVINDKEYTWPDTDETYRGTEITISDLQENVTATVYFTASANTYTLTPIVVDENGGVNAALADIKAVDAQNGQEITDLTALAEKSSVTLKAKVTNPTNNMVKEWQTSKDGSNYTTVKASGGQEEITLYNISSNLYVRAVITAADYHEVSYEVHCGGTVVTDDKIAKMEAKCKKDTIANGSTVAALIPIDFTVTLSDDYYIDSWSKNVTSDSADNHKASLEALTEDTKVIVNIIEKPKVEVTGAAGGKITVTGIYAGDEVTFAEIDNKTGEKVVKHLDPGSDVTVTYEPKTGYIVDEETVEGANYTDGDGKTTDNKVKVYSNNTNDLTIGGNFSQLDKVKVTYSTVINTGDQANGSLTASANRKGMNSYQINPLASDTDIVKTSNVTFTASPDEGYRVKEWKINGSIVKTDGMTEIGNTISRENVSEDMTVTVSFEHAGQEVIAESGDHGAIVGAQAAGADLLENLAGGLFLTEGTKLKLTAKADTGYQIESWTVNGQKVKAEKATGDAAGDAAEAAEEIYTGESYTYTTSKAGAIIRVYFNPISYKVTLGGENCTVTAPEGTGADSTNSGVTGTEISVKGGQTITLTAEADQDYVVDYWTVNGKKVMDGDDTFAGTSLEWTAPEGVESCEYKILAHAKAEEKPIVNYTVSFKAEGEGTVNEVKEGSSTLASGESFTMTAAPKTYYRLKKWVDSNGNEITEGLSADGLSLTLTNVTEDKSITAIFAEAIRYPVSYEVGHDDTIDDQTTYGKVTGKIIDASQKEEKLLEGKTTNGIGGSKVEFTAEPKEGFMIESWEVNDKVQACKLNTFTIESLSKSTRVKANFTRLISYEIPKEGSYNDSNLLEGNEKEVSYTLSERTLDPALENIADDQIRKEGKVTYLVKAAQGKRITNISIINSDDEGQEIKDLAEDQNVLTKERKEDGSYLITIDNINAHVALDIDTVNIYKLTINAPAKGTITVTDSKGNVIKSGTIFDEGTVLDCKITTPNGWKLEGWTGDLSGTSTTNKLTMTKESVIGAKVVSLWRKVTIINSTKGKLVVTDEKGKVITSGTQVLKGSKLICKATPARYYYFKSWTGDVKGTTASITHVVEDHTTVGVTFEKINSAGINAGLKATANNSKCTVSWGYVDDADGYDIYVTKCGKKVNINKPSKTIKNKKTLKASFTQVGGQKFSKVDCYKIQVRSFKMVGPVKKYTEKSFTFHIANQKHRKYTNVKAVKVNKTNVVLKSNTSLKLKVTLTKAKKKKALLEKVHRSLVVYYSSDTTVAKVDKNGKITAIAPGTCKIYVISISGAIKTVNVTVK